MGLNIIKFIAISIFLIHMSCQKKGENNTSFADSTATLFPDTPDSIKARDSMPTTTPSGNDTIGIVKPEGDSKMPVVKPDPNTDYR